MKEVVIENIPDIMIGYNEERTIGSKGVAFITYGIHWNPLLEQRIKIE